MGILVTGDDINIEQTLTKNGVTFPIDSGATIQASLITRDRTTVLVAPVAVLEATPGSSWVNSKIIILFSESDTATITEFGPILLEIQVDDGGKLTWFVKLELSKGTIDQ